MTDFFDRARAELQRARSLHPGEQASLHEGYAILLEEVDELWDLVKLKSSARDDDDVRSELVQIAAMAGRMAEDRKLILPQAAPAEADAVAALREALQTTFKAQRNAAAQGYMLTGASQDYRNGYVAAMQDARTIALRTGAAAEAEPATNPSDVSSSLVDPADVHREPAVPMHEPAQVRAWIVENPNGTWQLFGKLEGRTCYCDVEDEAEVHELFSRIPAPWPVTVRALVPAPAAVSATERLLREVHGWLEATTPHEPPGMFGGIQRRIRVHLGIPPLSERMPKPASAAAAEAADV